MFFSMLLQMTDPTLQVIFPMWCCRV